MSNRYNAEQRKVTPVASPLQGYAITPAQAQQLERIAQPIYLPDAPVNQVSETRIDVSQIFEPLAIKEQFSPAQRAYGFFIRALPFVGSALVVSVAGAWKLQLSTVDWFMWFACLLVIVFVFVNHQENTYSSAGLAVRHQADAKDALHVIVESNERVTLAKLENEDKAHKREIELRREVLAGYIQKLGGE